MFSITIIINKGIQNSLTSLNYSIQIIIPNAIAIKQILADKQKQSIKLKHLFQRYFHHNKLSRQQLIPFLIFLLFPKSRLQPNCCLLTFELRLFLFKQRLKYKKKGIITANTNKIGKQKVRSQKICSSVSYLQATLAQIHLKSEILRYDIRDRNPAIILGYINMYKYMNVVVITLNLYFKNLVSTPIKKHPKNTITQKKGKINCQIIREQ
ncbi:unnamed protein product [Paramecium sonneborni]|uniref:Uncharacterized protein n=1 Tax=Paramecium sonneborni TaxID=65129 RepID=A0A8S1MXV7_9CILI|nr:unnamed protein product [Paramecium sonneborni]